MKPSMRNYQSEEDYWCIREFLREVSLLNDRHDFAWSLLRWDYWRWHVNENIFHCKLEDVVTLWEAEGRIAAMLNPDSPGEAFFQVHPAHHGSELLSEMLDVAEQKLATQKQEGRKELIAWVNEKDGLHTAILSRRGYVRSRFAAEHMRRRSISTTLNAALFQPIPDCLLRQGTLSARWGTRANYRRAAGFPGRLFIRRRGTRSTRAGNGIETFSACLFTAAIWISSRSRRMGSWLLFARSGSTMSRAARSSSP